MAFLQGRHCDNAATVWGGLYSAAFGVLCSARRRLMSPPSFGAAGFPHSHDAPAFGDRLQVVAILVKSENGWRNIYTNNVNRLAIECHGSQTG